MPEHNRPPLSPLAQAVVDAHYGAPAMTAPNRPPLSPAAQEVLNATKVRFYESPPTGAQLAAWILRALADHEPAPITLGQPIDHWNPDDHTRQELRNLAEELESADG